MTERDVAVCELRTPAEFDACVAIQIAVWGYADGDVIPRRMFVLASHIGGQVFGAWVEGELAGFAMALPGVRDGAVYLHSHMLAVLPGHRDLGLGRRLKLAQREEAMARGIGLMEWTFDPMQAKNAYFNLERLGAVCSRYERNLYGESSSLLQGGLPTDRLVAQWWMGSERVRRAIAGEGVVPPGEAKRVVLRDGEDRTAGVQGRLREELEDGLARGLRVLGFLRDERGGGAYVLGREEGIGRGVEVKTA